jgi:hypothetical protein
MFQPAQSQRSAAEVLAALADDPTERRLSEVTSHYVAVLETLPWDLDHVALIVVPVTDGLLILPVTHITTGEGWEHLDLDAACCFPAPADWEPRTTAFRRAQCVLLNMLTEAAQAAGEASSHG